VPVLRIKLTLPTVEIGPRDLVFEVFIDGEAQGTFHVSKGGLDWWPTTSDGMKSVKTWSQLRAFMEGDAKDSPADEPVWSPQPPDEEIIDSRDSLFRIIGIDDFDAMEDVVDEMMGSDFGFWLAVEEGGDGSEGFVINTGKYQVEKQYPFTMGEFRDAVEDLDTMGKAETSYDELASQIESVEGFPVQVTFDWVDLYEGEGEPEVQWLRGRYCATAFPSEYPYQRAMNGSKTIQEWITNRFEPNYPWLVVDVDTKLPDTTLLSDLRADQLVT
jgi:hypothetical protein